MMELSNSLITGVECIDNQHREIISRVNRLVKVCTTYDPSIKTEAKEILNFLEGYVSTHFKDEEKLQLECHYPQYDAHKNQHHGFIKDFLELQADFEKSPVIDNILLCRINVALVDWLVSHIGNSDVAFAKYYISYKEAEYH